MWTSGWKEISDDLKEESTVFFCEEHVFKIYIYGGIVVG